MAHEVPRLNLSQSSAARAVTSWCLNTYFRTRQDVSAPEMFCREDLAGHLAVDARTLAAGKEGMLYMFMGQSNRPARDRDCGYAAVAYYECPKAFRRHYPRGKNLTLKAPCA